MKTANAITNMVLGGVLAVMLALPGGRASAGQPVGFSQAELDQMLAPIALYPDTVLSHVLIAATYPLEVVQAARWSRAHPEYAGEYAVAAVEHKPWDPSVMALVAFPELLARMDADLDWTQRLGDAFLVQEHQVLDTIQYLRDDAYASGHLRSNEYVRVVREPSYIYIEPAVTRVVYVPYYDPRVVYGAWRYSAYPPVYWDYPRGYRHRSGFSFYWSGGHHVQSAFFFSSFHWSSRRVVVHDHYRYGHRDRGRYAYGGHGFSSGREVAHYKDARHWQHNPEHRRGVAYSRGIDERQAIKTSNRSGGHNDSRRELLRQRSRTTEFTAQRSIARANASESRDRQSSGRTQRSRNAIQRGNNTGRQADRRETAATNRRGSNAAGSRSSSQRSRQPDTRRATPDRASARRELAQGRTSLGRSVPRTDSRATTRPNRARNPQARSSSRNSPSRAVQQSSSRSRSSATGRAAYARSRPSSGSDNARARSSRQANSRESSKGTPSRKRQASAPSRTSRAEAPAPARSRGSSSRAETLRSRGRERRQ